MVFTEVGVKFTVGGGGVGVPLQAPSNKTSIMGRRMVEYAVRLTYRECDWLIEVKILLSKEGIHIIIQPL